MELVPILLGKRDFLTKAEIIDTITKSKNFDPSVENTSTAVAIVFFENSYQKNWLVATSVRTYCILDDIQTDEPNINWSMPNNKFIKENEAEDTLAIRVKDKSDNVGLIDFGGEHKNWLYSKNLFKEKSIMVSISDLLPKNLTDGLKF